MKWNAQESGRSERLAQHKLGEVSSFSWGFLVYLLVQIPVYLFWYPIHVVRSLYNALVSMREATTSDVMDLMFESSLVILIRQVKQDLPLGKTSPGMTRELYTMEVPECKLVFTDRQGQPFYLKSWSIVFSMSGDADYKNATIERFLVNDKVIYGIHEMFSVLAVYLILGHHPRAHITAEVLQQKIEQNRIHQLYPSLFITRALHTGLLHSFASPITYTPFGIIPSQLNVDKKSLFVDEAHNWNSMSHTGIHLFRHTVPFVQFLWKARESCLRHTRPLGLDTIHGEYFFLTTVVHAVDHVNVARILHNVRCSMELTIDLEKEEGKLNSTWYTLFRSSVFFKTFVDSTTNPLFSNKIFMNIQQQNHRSCTALIHSAF
ncbi:hypothetical protein HDU79_007316 [Rhizoclosmatium sp. JEL0117]|nr:hypothetical protein HDU79_007316 [Rhizoclosmatium sp. JEL0117]